MSPAAKLLEQHIKKNRLLFRSTSNAKSFFFVSFSQKVKLKAFVCMSECAGSTILLVETKKIHRFSFCHVKEADNSLFFLLR